MSLTRLLITAVVVENRSVAHVAAHYGVSQSWLFELVARYKAEGEAAFESRAILPSDMRSCTAPFAGVLVRTILRLANRWPTPSC